MTDAKLSDANPFHFTKPLATEREPKGGKNMADDFQSSNGSWWSAEQSQATTSIALSDSCFTASSDIGGGGGFSWVSTDVVEESARSGDEPVVSGSASGSSITYQETHPNPVVTDPMSGCTSSMDDSFRVAGLSDRICPMFDWNQPLKSSGRAEDSFRAAIPEDLSSRQLLEHRQDAADANDRSQGNAQGSWINLAKGGVNYQGSFPQDIQHLRSFNQPLLPKSYGYTWTFVRDTLNMENEPSNLPNEDLLAKFPQSLAYSPLLSSTQRSSSNHPHLSNNTLFWNASAGATTTEARSGHFASVISPHFAPQGFDEQPIVVGSSLTIENSEAAKKSSSETALKKPRIETASPLPTFKVRKEKLGDRITALQQLVSPFGKTDTASVLHEAIEYIKFLHEQVGVLCNPYSKKNGHPMQQQQNPSKSKDCQGPKQDLRSRGLCLVPVAITFPVASDTSADFWTPTFGSTYR